MTTRAFQKIYTKIDNITKATVTLRAQGVGNDELATVGGKLAQVVKIMGEHVTLQVFAGTEGLSTASEVIFHGEPPKLRVSDNLAGRFFNAYGEPLEGGEIVEGEEREIGGPTVNPFKRIQPSELIATGIAGIDLNNTIVTGQKIPFFADPDQPYNAVMANVALRAKADKIILGGMGLKYDDYLYFRNTLDAHGALSRSVLFIHTAADPTVECLMVPDMSLAVAESYALEGKRVLVLLTDMTNFADALKEIAITMEQIPANRGYPGDLYSQLASRYEKAVDFEGAGSITILAATTMPGDDVTHPIPDNTGYITEGQFYLRHGRIEPFGSLSRLKQQVNGKTRGDHRAIMDSMIRLYSDYRGALEKQSMGFMMTEWDRKLLKYGKLFEERMMDLSVNIPLESALDLGSQTLAECFEQNEVGIKTDLVRQYWPKSASAAGK